MEFTITAIPALSQKRGRPSSPEMQAVKEKIHSMQVGEKFRAGPFPSTEDASRKSKGLYQLANAAGITICVRLQGEFIEFERTE